MEVRSATSFTLLENNADEKYIVFAGKDTDERPIIVSLFRPAFNAEQVETLLHTGIIKQDAILENGKFSQWDVTVQPEFSRYNNSIN